MNNHIARVLSIRPFFLLWMAEIFSQLAMNMVNFVLILVAFKLTSSNAAVSGIVLSFTIPAIIFGMLAGVFVDRWNKKLVLFYTNIFRTLLLLALAVFNGDLLFIYILSFLVSIVTQFFIPAETPVIPLIVKKDLLLSANALFGMGIYGSVVIAYALSGPFFVIFEEEYVFIILAVFFLIASMLVAMIRIPAASVQKEIAYEKKSHVTIPGEIKSALSLMAKTREIYHSIILLTLSQVLILILAVIGPGFANQILGVTIDKFPLLFVTPAALGMIIGALILGNFFHSYGKEKCATLGVLLSGVMLILLPLSSKVVAQGFITIINSFLPVFLSISTIHIVIVLAFILGVANALVFVPSNTILQEETSDEYRGRMYGVLNAMVGIFSLFPIIIVGELADFFGVAKVLMSIGGIILCIGIVRIFPVIRKK